MVEDPSHEVVIRLIEESDAPAAAALSDELGYRVSSAEMRRRIVRLAGLGDHAVYVSLRGADVVGWIDVGIVHHLQSEPYAEIGGLVVSRSARNFGIGKLLIREVEKWARDRELKNLLVRSNVVRDAAHRFYLRQHFVRTKTSAVFTKSLT